MKKYSNEELLTAIRGHQNFRHSFSGAAGHKLSYLEFGKSGHEPVLVFPGMGEPSIKYWELAQELSEAQFHVFVLDHLGHGASDYAASLKSSSRVHVDDFSYYIQDLEIFFDLVSKQCEADSLHVVAHSMAGLLSLNLATKKRLKSLFLSSPMLKVNTKGVPYPIAKVLARALPSQAAAPLQVPLHNVDLSRNQITNCQKRANFLQELYKCYPDHKRDHVSNGWLRSALHWSQNVEELEPFVNETLPILMFQAEKDTVIVPRRNELFARTLKTCQFNWAKGARHEVLMEKDSIRSPIIESLHKFLKENS